MSDSMIERVATMKSRESILARVQRNLASKRYLLDYDDNGLIAVWDQRERRFVPDDELASIDPEAKMSLR